MGAVVDADDVCWVVTLRDVEVRGAVDEGETADEGAVVTPVPRFVATERAQPTATAVTPPISNERLDTGLVTHTA